MLDAVDLTRVTCPSSVTLEHFWMIHREATSFYCSGHWYYRIRSQVLLIEDEYI